MSKYDVDINNDTKCLIMMIYNRWKNQSHCKKCFSDTGSQNGIISLLFMAELYYTKQILTIQYICSSFYLIQKINLPKFTCQAVFLILGCQVMGWVKPCMMYDAHWYVNMESIVTFIHRIFIWWNHNPFQSSIWKWEKIHLYQSHTKHCYNDTCGPFY